MISILRPALFLLVLILEGYSIKAQSIELLSEIRPGKGNSDIGNFNLLNDKLYFTINDSLHGNEIWMTDGTKAGTLILKDIAPGTASSNAAGFKVINSKMYFSATDGTVENLYVSDGTDTGTKPLGTVRNARNFITYNSKIYFTGTTPATGQELWMTDGTDTGTKVVKDIYPANLGSNVTAPVLYKGLLFFGARTPQFGGELWSSDGTEAGTMMIRDISGGMNSVADQLTVFNGRLYFTYNAVGLGTEYWSTDGTDPGTIMLKDISPGFPNTTFWNDAVVFNGKMYFGATTSVDGTELWCTDGTETGTTMVKDINPGPASSFARRPFIYKNKLYFTANDGINGMELWASDGTDTGTKQVFDLSLSVAGSTPSAFREFNNKLYFRANDSINGYQLWVTNGSDTTQMLTKELPIYKSALSQLDHSFGILNNELYFPAVYSVDTGMEVHVLRAPKPPVQRIAKRSQIPDAKVYPNPVKDILTLDYTLLGTSRVSVALYDMTGRLVANYITNEVRNAGAHTDRLEIPALLAQGLYQLRLQYDDTYTTINIVR